MQKAVQDHGVRFTVATGTVAYAGRTCHLEPKQIDLLEHLLDAYPDGVSADVLLTETLGDDVLDVSDIERLRNNLRIQFVRMRSKLWEAGVCVTIVNRRGWGERNEYFLLPGILPVAPRMSGRRGIPRPGQRWPARTRFFVVEGQQLVRLKRVWKYDAACGRTRAQWVRP